MVHQSPEVRGSGGFEESEALDTLRFDLFRRAVAGLDLGGAGGAEDAEGELCSGNLDGGRRRG